MDGSRHGFPTAGAGALTCARGRVISPGVTRHPPIPGVLAVLRSRGWRPLLLAFALLAAWGRCIAPAQAASHAAAPGGQVCLASGGATPPAGTAEAAVTGESCPFCRLPDLPAALAAPVPEPVVAVSPLAEDPPPRIAGALSRQLAAALPRGPPAPASSG